MEQSVKAVIAMEFVKDMIVIAAAHGGEFEVGELLFERISGE